MPRCFMPKKQKNRPADRVRRRSPSPTTIGDEPPTELAAVVPSEVSSSTTAQHVCRPLTPIGSKGTIKLKTISSTASTWHLNIVAIKYLHLYGNLQRSRFNEVY